MRRRPPGNLPLLANSFVGRERELAEVRTLLASSRLVTLTGPGGCGKTRLALEVAGLAENFEDGVFLVELAGISDGELVPETAARTLGARLRLGLSPTEELANHLEAGETLLVLDNCEHVVDACADLADTLLRSCPGLKILATSREALAIAGEMAWPVPSLSLPDTLIDADPDDTMRFGAVRLFAERAAAVAPGFALTPENTAAVARVCERLEGMPLAIELAAARARVLSPAQIASRLDDRFLLLTGGGRVTVPRHKTLRATMDWGHELLSPQEKALFRRLSAFPGGFSLEAAEAVCPGGDFEADEVLGLLSRLVDKSLVVVGGRGEENSYRMLETVLSYASERLEDSGEAESVRARHADFFLGLAEEAEPGLFGAQQGAWLGRLDADSGNLRAALGWHTGSGEAEGALRMAGALWWYWFLRGRYQEGCGRLEGALARSGADGSLHRARALTAAGDLAFLQARYARAEERIGEGLTLYRALGDSRGVAGAVQLLGSIAREQGRYAEAVSRHEESLALWRELDDDWGIAQSLNYLGFVAWLRGDPDRATELCARALGKSRCLGDGEGVAWSLMNLGTAALYRGEHDRAAELLEESLSLSREGGYRETVAWALDGLGEIARRENRLEPAAKLLRESLTLHRDLGDRWRMASLLEGIGKLAATLGDFARAGRLFGAADALREHLGDPVPPAEREDLDRAMTAARAGIGEDAFANAWAAGRGTPIDDVLHQALTEGPVDSSCPASSRHRLSDREAEVLGLVAEGLTDPEVAQRLYLSPRTVGQHLRNIYRKLGVRSRIAASRAAIERGLI